jgi:hypothetical protein
MIHIKKSGPVQPTPAAQRSAQFCYYFDSYSRPCDMGYSTKTPTFMRWEAVQAVQRKGKA